MKNAKIWIIILLSIYFLVSGLLLLSGFSYLDQEYSWFDEFTSPDSRIFLLGVMMAMFGFMVVDSFSRFMDAIFPPKKSKSPAPTDPE